MLLDQFTKYDYPLFGWVKLPRVDIDLEDTSKLGLPANVDHFVFIQKLIESNFNKKIKKENEAKARERIDYELGVLNKLGFIDYILLVWQMTNQADKEKIARGLGRGSAAGCYVLYLIGATKIDSLRYNLLFERFVNEARAKSKLINGQLYIDGKSSPDIDCDFSIKEPIVEFLKTKYPGKVCKILNIASLTGKNLVKETLKVVENANEDEAKKASDTVPKIFGVVADIKEAYFGKKNEDGSFKKEPVKDFVEWADLHKKTFNIACKINELFKNTGIHASGYIVSADLLSDYIPCQLASDEDGARDIVGCYTMDWIAKLSVKVDILKVRCCAVVQDVANEVGIDIDSLNLDDDPEIYDQLKRGMKNTKGCFQVEADCVGGVIREVKPSNLNEMSDCVAIGRPGALAYKSDYVKGNKECPHELFKDILGSTRNMPLFQEQLMQLLVVIGFTLVEADNCRRIVGKKLREEVDAWEIKVKEKCKEKGFDLSIGEMIWKILRESADYSFNRCIYEESEVFHREKGHIKLNEVHIGDFILAYDVNNGLDHYVRVTNIYKNKKTLVWSRVGNNTIATSIDHKFLTQYGMQTVDQTLKNQLVGCHLENCKNRNGWNIFVPAYAQFLKIGDDVYKKYNTIDLEVDHADHNFYCNDIIVSNSHSLSYGALAAITVKLKTAYPLPFYKSLLNHAKEEPKPFKEISEINNEMRMMKIPLYPPDVYHSDLDFKIENHGIRFGLGSIKGFKKAAEAIVNFKKPENKFDFFSTSKEIGLKVNNLSALIMCGAMDSLRGNASRSYLALQGQLWYILSEKEWKLAFDHGEQFNYNLIQTVSYLNKEAKNEKGQPLIKDSRLETISKKFAKNKEIFELNKKYPEITDIFYENLVLGYCHSQELSKIFKPYYENIIPIEKISNCENDDKVEFVGIVKEKVETRKSRAGNDYGQWVIRDESGETRVMIFNSSYENKLDNIRLKHGGKLPTENAVVFVSGKKKDDVIFANNLISESVKIYTSFKMLADKEDEDMESM